MSQKVVAHFLDGRLEKGTSLDVDLSRPTFHIRTVEGRTVEVALSDLKGLFFVRSLDGNAMRAESFTLAPNDPRAHSSTLLSMRFPDGELIIGLTIRYPPNRPYFYVIPVDPGSNNIRMLINRAAVVSMKSPPESGVGQSPVF